MKKYSYLSAALLVVSLTSASAWAQSYAPTGVQQNVPEATVTAGGWTACLQRNYSGTPSTTVASILAACSQSQILMACRPVGAANFTILAQAPRAAVFADTGTGNVVTTSNGVGWYFNASYSYGFAPAGEAVSRGSCDTASSQGGLRMCVHTGAGFLNSGWRCGNATWVYDATYEQVIFQSSSTADITGTITNSLGGAMSGITVANSGAASTSTNGSGVYSFTGLAAGSYTITPSVYNYVFSPLSRTVNLAGVNATGQDFVATYDGRPDITDLRSRVVAANLTDTRVRTSLLAPLDAALVWLNSTNPNKVAYSCSNLAKFIATTRQNISVGKLPAATGNPWIAAANDILSLSGCPTR